MSVARLGYEAYDAAHTFVSFDLGFGDLEARTMPHESAYWTDLAGFLAHLPRKSRREGPISLMVFLGDGILGDWGGKFVDVALDVVMGFQDERPVIRDEDPEFAVARGARELAVRWMARYSETGGSDAHLISTEDGVCSEVVGASGTDGGDYEFS